MRHRTETLKVMRFTACALALCFLRKAAAEAPKWPLAVGGKAESVIILGAEPSVIERHAAEELSHFLSKVTGSEIRRCESVLPGKYGIWLGTPESNPRIGAAGLSETVNALADQGFLLHADAEGLIIASKTSEGVLFGAYAFLEDHVGMRWFFPGAIGEYCPDIPDLKVGEINEVQEPAFRIREVTFSRAGPGGRTVDTWDWIARNRMQSAYSSLQHEDYTKRAATVRGGGHILGRMVPAALFDEHPEYFGMYDGERRPYNHPGRSGQPCTTHPAVIELAVAYMLEWFSENPDGVFTLNSNDNRNFCECDACTALDPPEEVERWGGEVSTRFFSFKNQVAKRVYEQYPDARIGTLAYMPYRLVPAVEIGLDPRIWVKLADHSRCFRHALADPECDWNQGGRYAPAGGFLKMYRDWSEFDNPRGNFPYYNMIAQYRHRAVPEGGIVSAPIENIVAADIRFQHRLGHQSWNMRLRPPDAFDPERYPPRTTMCWRANIQWYYLKAKLIWDPGRDVDALLADFYMKFYGPASDHMRNYHTLIRTLWEETPGHFLYHSTFDELGRSMNAEAIEKLSGLLDRAEKDAFEWTLLKDDPVFGKRLEDERKIFENAWKRAYELHRRNVDD